METNKRQQKSHVPVSSRKVIKIIFSILIALVVWAYVDEEKTVDVMMNVHNLPVEFAGEDTVLADSKLMLLSGFDTKVDLKLKGPRKVLWKLNKDEIRIVADTSSIKSTGVQTLTYEVVYPDTVQGSQIQVASASIYAITVTVGELFAKDIPVHCEVLGEVAAGFAAEELQLDPMTLRLRGQRDDLLSIAYAKVEVDISGARETVMRAVEYQLYDDNDIPVTNEDIRTASKLVQVTVPVKTVKEVPLRLNFVEAVGSTMAQVRYTLSQEKVLLKGDSEVLNNVDSIVLDTIYLQDLQGQQTLKYTVSVPEGTELVGETREVTVSITVDGVSEQRFTTSKLSCSNVPEGYTATVVTDSLSVLLRGLTAEINALTGESVHVTADLSNVTGAGNFTVAASVHINGYQNIGVKGSYQLIVLVEPAEMPEEQNLQPASLDDEAEPENTQVGNT